MRLFCRSREVRVVVHLRSLHLTPIVQETSKDLMRYGLKSHITSQNFPALPPMQVNCGRRRVALSLTPSQNEGKAVFAQNAAHRYFQKRQLVIYIDPILLWAVLLGQPQKPDNGSSSENRIIHLCDPTPTTERIQTSRTTS